MTYPALLLFGVFCAQCDGERSRDVSVAILRAPPHLHPHHPHHIHRHPLGQEPSTHPLVHHLPLIRHRQLLHYHPLTGLTYVMQFSLARLSSVIRRLWSRSRESKIFRPEEQNMDATSVKEEHNNNRLQYHHHHLPQLHHMLQWFLQLFLFLFQFLRFRLLIIPVPE